MLGGASAPSVILAVGATEEREEQEEGYFLFLQITFIIVDKQEKTITVVPKI